MIYMLPFRVQFLSVGCLSLHFEKRYRILLQILTLIFTAENVQVVLHGDRKNARSLQSTAHHTQIDTLDISQKSFF